MPVHSKFMFCCLEHDRTFFPQILLIYSWWKLYMWKLTDMEGQLHRMPESTPRTLSKTKSHYGFLHQRDKLGACRYKCVLSLNFLVIIRLIFQKHFCVVYSFLHIFSFLIFWSLLSDINKTTPALSGICIIYLFASFYF